MSLRRLHRFISHHAFNSTSLLRLTVVNHNTRDAHLFLYALENSLHALRLRQVYLDMGFGRGVLRRVGAARCKDDLVAARFEGRGEVGADVGAGA